MNGRASGRRLVLVAFCFAVLAVVGVGYSQSLEWAPVCELIEEVLSHVDTMLQDCENDGTCEELQALHDELDCQANECWDFVDGVCPA